MTVFAQSVSLVQHNGVIAFRAPGLDFIKGEPLDRLKDAQSVRVQQELEELPGPGGASAARSRQTYTLSYDLWEERFAVALSGPPARSVAYLSSSAAEDWCLEQLTVPVAALGRLGKELPFWIRLGYRIADPAADRGNEFSLRGLIDALSRKRRNTASEHAVEAGPFRLGQ